MTWSDGMLQDSGTGPPVVALLADLVTTLPWLGEPSGMRLRVLEAAGNGEGAETFVPLGHTVILLNASQEALDAARRQLLADPERLVGNVALARGTIADIPSRWPPASFDLILCHHILGRTIDPLAVLQALVAVLKPGGYLSLALGDGTVGRSTQAGLRGDEHLSGASVNGHPAPVRVEAVAQWLGELELTLVSQGRVGTAAPFRHLVARKPVVFPIPL